MLTVTVQSRHSEELSVSFVEGFEYPLKSLFFSVLAVNSSSPAALEKK